MSEDWKDQIEQALRDWELAREELRQKTVGQSKQARAEEASGAVSGETTVSLSMEDLLDQEELSLLLGDVHEEEATNSQTDSENDQGLVDEGIEAPINQQIDKGWEPMQVAPPHEEALGERAWLPPLERQAQDVLRGRGVVPAEVDVDEEEERLLRPAELEEAMQILCRHKADDFALMGYESIDEATILTYIQHKYGREWPRLHRLANEVMSLRVNQVMNWLTAKAYKGEAL